MDEEGACALALQVLTGAFLPAVLSTAIELDLLELIKKAGPAASLSSAQLAAQIPTTNPEAPGLLDRILRLLAANNILECSLRTLPHGGVERLYSLSPVSKFFTSNEDGVSLAPLLLMGQHKVFVETWYHIKDAVLEGGIPFNIAHGMSAFEYHASDPKFNKAFNQAMHDQSAIFMKRILEIYKGFEGVESLVDVGGGIGAILKMIISKYPFIKGINFDLPHVIQDALPHPGVEHISGDMFVSVPRGDAIFMKMICHNWDDGHVLKLLKNCYAALPDTGKLIIVDRIVPEIPTKDIEASNDYVNDLLMFTIYTGGKERTETEFRTLAKASGFKQFHKVCRCFSLCIMELHK